MRGAARRRRSRSSSCGNRDLRVCFVHVPEDPSVEDYASCLIGVDESTGKCKIDYRVKLPGNPVIGEGKPENQNHAVIFARGAHLQTLDMNQDTVYMGEAYKMSRTFWTVSNPTASCWWASQRQSSPRLTARWRSSPRSPSSSSRRFRD